MIELHNLKWYFDDPTRLLKMKPFTRGGHLLGHGYEGRPILNNTFMDVGFSNLELHPISQDTYITEYRSDLHHIILNKAIPKIKVVLDGTELPTNLMEITQTASFQKIIHSAHVRNLTANPLEFSLYDNEPNDTARKCFDFIKQEWMWRGREWDKYQAINTCKQLGNCATLFYFDKSTGKYDVENFSYEDGYQIIPNYNEYGREIARTLAYEIDGATVMDVYDAAYHYRVMNNSDGGWTIEKERHGFPVCPLLTKRGKVAWEYAESAIEMWELMANIQAIALKRFGTFSLVLIGDMDADSFKRDSSTLIINLSSDQTNGKQDAKVLEFPEPQTMDGYLKTLEEKISLFSSTAFITPKDISTSNSGGNGIALAMSNDYALATQSALDWQKYVNDMIYLHRVGLDLESGGVNKYGRLKIGAKILPWSLETNNTKITNLTMEGTYLSTQTMIEKCPDAAPDEVERVIKERGALIPKDQVGNSGKMNENELDDETQKAYNMAINRNDLIANNVKQDEPIND